MLPLKSVLWYLINILLFLVPTIGEFYRFNFYPQFHNIYAGYVSISFFVVAPYIGLVDDL